MIDTKLIRAGMNQLVAYHKIQTINKHSWRKEDFKPILIELLDSHDELERKLKWTNVDVDLEKIRIENLSDQLEQMRNKIAELANDCDTYISDIKRFKCLNKNLERKLEFAKCALYTVWSGKGSLDDKSEICRMAIKEIRGE